MKTVVHALLLGLLIVNFSAEAKTKKSKKKTQPVAEETATTPETTPTPTPTVTPVATPPPTAASTEEKKDDKFANFKKPLFFAVDDSEVKVKNPVIAYNLKKDKKDKSAGSLTVGDYVFTNDSLKAQMDQDNLQITWDTQLVATGDLSIIDSYGKELWKTALDNSGNWKFSDWKGKNVPQWKSGDHFRFCLRAEKEKGFVSMCTATYGIEINDQKIKLDYTKPSGDARVIVLNEERKKMQDSVEVTVGAPAQFLGTLPSGATYEFISEPIALELKDFIGSEQKDMITFKGSLPAPLAKDVKLIPGIEYGKVTKALGFQRTIAEPKDLWQLDVPVKDTKIQTAGKSGGVFTYNLEVISYPKATDRLYVRDNSITGTYLKKDKILVKVPKEAQIDGLMAVDEKTKDDPELRTWEFAAENKYEMNKPQLLLKDDKATHKAYLEVYHGAAGEASLRVSGLATSSGSTAILGEAHVLYWFNDLFGWQNDYLSKQRWGVSAKYFSALQKLPADQADGSVKDVDLSSTQIDLRYRFSQGLWGRDETVGLIGSYEALTVGDQKANKLGAGIFWARSMPKVFDNWFNKISWLNHPKYVDMEYVQFFSSTDSDTTMGSDYLVNFHGKIMWTRNFFGEAGFGMKSYNFRKTDSTGAKLSTLYGTLGVGLDF